MGIILIYFVQNFASAICKGSTVAGYSINSSKLVNQKNCKHCFSICCYLGSVKKMLLTAWQLISICVLCTALAYKGIDYEYRAVNLVKDGGEQVELKCGFLLCGV